MRRNRRACYVPGMLAFIAACGSPSGAGPRSPVAVTAAPAAPPPTNASSAPAPSKTAPPSETAPPAASVEPEPAEDEQAPADDAEAAHVARADLRDRLREACRTYLTSADVKQVCGRQIRIVDLDELGGPPDEWPPACVRTAPYDKEGRLALHLTIDNADPDPRALVAALADDAGARARALDIGDRSVLASESSDTGVERAVIVAVGPMLVSLSAAGPNAKRVPCSDAQLVKLARRIVDRLPR